MHICVKKCIQKMLGVKLAMISVRTTILPKKWEWPGVPFSIFFHDLSLENIFYFFYST